MNRACIRTEPLDSVIIRSLPNAKTLPLTFTLKKKEKEKKTQEAH